MIRLWPAPVYLEAVEHSSDRAAAAEALWWASILGEHDEMTLNEAAADYARLARDFPESEYAQQAAFRGGLSYYRLGDFESARTTWSALAEQGRELWHAAADFWLGKILVAENKEEEALAHWQGMVERWSDNNYYGLRARQTLAEMNGASFSPNASTDSSSNVSPNLAIWLAGWTETTLPPDIGNSSLSAANSIRPEFEKPVELHRIGDTLDARASFESLRNQWAEDPVALVQLAYITEALGYYDTSIRAAARTCFRPRISSIYPMPCKS